MVDVIRPNPHVDELVDDVVDETVVETDTTTLGDPIDQFLDAFEQNDPIAMVDVQRKYDLRIPIEFENLGKATAKTRELIVAASQVENGNWTEAQFDSYLNKNWFGLKNPDQFDTPSGTPLYAKDGTIIYLIKTGPHAGQFFSPGLQEYITKESHPELLPATASPPKEAISSGFGEGWRGSDGNVYFNPEQVPEDVTIVEKVGSSSGTVPYRWQKIQTDAVNDNREIASLQSQIVLMLQSIPKTVWSGVRGRAAESLKTLFGSQDAASNWRNLVSTFRTTIGLANLPPGAASDKDVALVMEGVPDQFANPEAVTSYAKGVDKLANYKKRYNVALINYIEKEKTGAGFENVAPKFDPEGADQATSGTVPSEEVFTIDDL